MTNKIQPKFIKGVCIIFLAVITFSFSDAYDEPVEGHFPNEKVWVDSIFNSMTLDDKIGQLFMIRAHSDLGKDHIDEVKRQIKKYKIGGLCFFQGTPAEQARLTNEYNGLSDVPLLIAIDAEWGLGMRMKNSATSYPRNMTLGALSDDRWIYDMGKTIGKELSMIGVNINFAPVADVNLNPANPVIHTRSFGENPISVAEKSALFAQGMRAAGVAACAKHFPGHGDTNKDSHHDLPILNFSRSRLDSVELLPFLALAKDSIESFMIAHLAIPKIDSTEHLAASLSQKIIKGILRNEFSYEGVVFTDGLEMKGATKHFKPGRLEVKALQAGNDVLLLPLDIDESFKQIKIEIEKGAISLYEIDKSVKRILKLKYKSELYKSKYIDVDLVNKKINIDNGLLLRKKIYEGSFTLIANNGVLPLSIHSQKRYGILHIGTPIHESFNRSFDQYANSNKFYIRNINKEGATEVIDRINSDKFEELIINLNSISNKPFEKFNVSERLLNLLTRISDKKKTVLINYSSPYALQYLPLADAVINAYENNKLTQGLSPEFLFGALPFRGRLPVSIPGRWDQGHGKFTNDKHLLRIAEPKAVQLNKDTLMLIDSIVEFAIKNKILPGCEVLVVKDGYTVFNKSYGHHTYNQLRKNEIGHLYDYASITKVAATTLAIMKLHDEKRINIYNRLDVYLPELKKTNKATLTIYDIMGHHARLKPWIPFYRSTLDVSKSRIKYPDSIYSHSQSQLFSIPVSKKLYLNHSYRDTIWNKILDSELRTNNNERYSDLGFYILREIVERITGEEFDSYVINTFYRPLGLRGIQFNPWQSQSMARIVPSEIDDYYRKGEIRGYVHDMGAAMLGGISGHAGLFGTAQDLAIIMQMFLNYGYYAGNQHLSYSTIREFTARYPGSSRRAIGFDMKELDSNKRASSGTHSSERTFGHMGFTGTAMWADPLHNIIFVFLSNRTYPDMSNFKINEEQIRQRLHDVVYRAIQ